MRPNGNDIIALIDSARYASTANSFSHKHFCVVGHSTNAMFLKKAECTGQSGHQRLSGGFLHHALSGRTFSIWHPIGLLTSAAFCHHTYRMPRFS